MPSYTASSKKHNCGGSWIFYCVEGLNKVHNHRVLQDSIYIYALFPKFRYNLLLGVARVARQGWLTIDWFCMLYASVGNPSLLV